MTKIFKEIKGFKKRINFISCGKLIEITNFNQKKYKECGFRPLKKGDEECQKNWYRRNFEFIR